jgi:hypothetical protein
MTQDANQPTASGKVMTKPRRRGLARPAAVFVTLGLFLLVWTVSVWHYFRAP